MIEVRDIYKLQTDYSVADGSFKESEMSFDDYVAQCRVFTSANLPEDYLNGGWDSEAKQATMTNIISQFIDLHKVNVRGYMTPEGVLNATLLLEDVINSVTGVSILKEALEDPEVDEIQINDKDTIFVARRGVLVPYVDSYGRIMQFGSNEEIHIVLNKLIDDGTGNAPQFTDGMPILNAKTSKDQYRINAVHHIANTRDKPPYNYPITTVVIRKFKETKLTIEDLIKHEAVTPKMGRLLEILGTAELKLFCVGPTGSGKTTLLNIIANEVPSDKRLILVQNPTEISFMERDEHRRNIRNVVHWEVMNAVAMDALISNTLRATPEVILVGEARENDEFFQIQRAMRTGHKVLGTFHAEDAKDGVGRFATELSSVGGTSYMESVRLVADTIDIIISQFKFPDGRRRVMEISEIDGVDENGDVKVNTLFEFKLSGETRKNQYGLTEVLGNFEQVGVISERIQKMFYKAGVNKQDILEFLTINNEPEKYISNDED